MHGGPVFALGPVEGGSGLDLPGEDSRTGYEAVYRELRRRAQYFLSGERPGHTLRPTEIVHEVWMRMKSVDLASLQRREDFLAMAGKIMRNLLVDYARSRKAARRGGNCARIHLPNELLFSDNNLVLILEIDELLSQLAFIDQRAATIVEMKFFAGLTEEEVALALDVSLRTVKRDWGFAKLWMRANLQREGGGNALAVNRLQAVR